MAKKIDNPRYPHQCRIYRMVGATSFSPGEEKEIYSGPCRKSSSDNIRAFEVGSNTTGKVNSLTYRVSMPGIIKGIQKGDLIDVESRIGSEIGMRIVSFADTELQEGKTAVLCTTTSN